MRRRRRRLPRILLNAATAVSLALLVATAVLWVRSYLVADLFLFGTPEREDQVSFTRGAIVIEFLTVPHLAPGMFHLTDAPGNVARSATEMGFAPHWHWLGVEYSPDANLIALPLWAFAALSLLVPASRALRWMRRARQPASAGCLVCGYDLRATPERCPECGTVNPRP